MVEPGCCPTRAVTFIDVDRLPRWVYGEMKQGEVRDKCTQPVLGVSTGPSVVTLPLA